jgi:hypothetical protein
MNKLITKRIRNIEAALVYTNNVAIPEAVDASHAQSLREHAERLNTKLDFHMAQSPEEISRDVMPAEAALEMLCDPKAKLSARMRKNCSDARATYYQSVRERKPGAVKLASRFQSAKLTQLGKWLRRAAARSAGTTKQLRKLDGVDNPHANMIREMLCVRGINLEISRAALRAELATRV